MSTNTTIGTSDEFVNVRRLTTEVTRLRFQRRHRRKKRALGLPGYPPSWYTWASECAAPDPSWLWFPRYSAKLTKRRGLCMHLVLERGVPQEERKVGLGNLTDWDAARVFLQVVRCGSFRSAAERLELSITGGRRRIDDFERQIGTTLFTRDVHATRLTDEGALVVAAVERMEAASFDLLRAGESAANTLAGEVRVAVTGLGTFWLAPRLVEFQPSVPI